MAFWNRKPAVAPIEEKALPAGTSSFDPDLYELLTGSSAASISSAQALAVPAVQACVRAISEAVATSPLALKRKVGGEEVNVESHPALPLVTRQANGFTSSFELIRDIVSASLVHDAGGLSWINRASSGRPVEIINYTPGGITVEYSPKGTGEPTYRIGGKKVKASDILHVRGAFSRSPLSLARESIAVAYTIEQHIGKLFSIGARPSGVIQFPQGVKLGDEALKKIKAGWKAAFGGTSGSGGTAVTWDGAEWKPLTFSSVDSQTLELLKEANLQIARSFRVPPSMIYELSRMTWSNFEAAGRDWVTYSLMPHLRAVESALDRALLTDEERGEFRFAFDVDDTTQADLTARSSAISTLITAKVLNPNEARDWLGMPPRDGGEIYENPAIQVTPANDNQPNKEVAA